MEKRVRRISIGSVFIRYLTGVGAFSILLAAAAVFLFWLLVRTGILYSASAGAFSYAKAAPLVSEMSVGDFDGSALPELCRYAVFDSGKREAVLLFTNMNEKQLETALEAWKNDGKTGRRIYHEAVTMQDGAVCYFQYDYAVPFVDARLREVIPDVQMIYLAILFLLWLGGVCLITRHYVRLLEGETRRLARAGEHIARRDLTPFTGERPRVKEFGQAIDLLAGLQMELAGTLEQQWRMEQEKKDTIAALAHDLKTPLTVIGGNAELLLEEKLTEEQRRCVETVLRNTEHAGEYVGRLRELMAAGDDGEQAAEPFSVRRFYEECAEIGKNLCRPKRITLLTAEAPDISLKADRHLLIRAVTNVLENAVRYTPENGRISFEADIDDNMLTITVQDFGPGFSAEALHRAGYGLYTSDAGRSQEGHQGMGLYFVRRTAEKHNGSLELSNTQKGGCVRIRLPLSCY